MALQGPSPSLRNENALRAFSFQGGRSPPSSYRFLKGIDTRQSYFVLVPILGPLQGVPELGLRSGKSQRLLPDKVQLCWATSLPSKAGPRSRFSKKISTCTDRPKAYPMGDGPRAISQHVGEASKEASPLRVRQSLLCRTYNVLARRARLLR